MLAALYMLYTFVLIKVKKDVVPQEAIREGEVIYSVWDGIKAFVPFIFLILAVMGAILAGICAPTEAAGLGAFGAFLIALAYRKINWQVLKESAISTLKTSTMIAFIAIGANIFTAVFFGVGCGTVVKQFIACLRFRPNWDNDNYTSDSIPIRNAHRLGRNTAYRSSDLYADYSRFWNGSLMGGYDDSYNTAILLPNTTFCIRFVLYKRYCSQRYNYHRHLLGRNSFYRSGYIVTYSMLGFPRNHYLASQSFSTN